MKSLADSKYTRTPPPSLQFPPTPTPHLHTHIMCRHPHAYTHTTHTHTITHIYTHSTFLVFSRHACDSSSICICHPCLFDIMSPCCSFYSCLCIIAQCGKAEDPPRIRPRGFSFKAAGREPQADEGRLPLGALLLACRLKLFFFSGRLARPPPGAAP